jgi:hypothetical protein
MHILQDRSAGLPVEIAATARSGPTPLALLASAPSDVWPLLVLDAGAFLTRCRWCDWKSTRESAPAAAMAAFDTHICEERLA